jgi:hypothetical protein
MSAAITIARASMLTRAFRPAAGARREFPASPLRAANAKVLAFPRPIRSPSTPSAAVVRASSDSDSEVSAPVLVVAAAGLPCSVVVLWSSYAKATTGAGLQGDLLGGLEGVSYLVMLALVALSIKEKVQTGGGLPAGPGGVVGASEGLNYLALLAAIVAFAYSAVNGN